MAISYRVTNQGAYELSCIVTEPGTPFAFYEHSQYFGYTKKEATRMFKEHLAAKGLKIVRG